MKRRGRLAAPSFFNNDDFRSAASNATCTSASSLLHPNTASGIRGGDVPHAFGDDFFSGHESVRGSSLSSSSSHFGYSEKSFHTSDGNLYSVFSPLQGQRSRSRPSSFLRQHLQQQHEQKHPGHQSHAQSSHQPPPSTSASNSNRNADQHQQQQKWRFQVREERSSNDNQSTTGSSRLFREETRSGGGGDDDEWFNRHDDIFSKEKQRFYQRSESPVFSRWPREEERFDISSLLKSKFSSASNATSGGGLFERQDSWSDDEEDGPLNLCLADRRRRRKSSSSSSKSDLEDHHHLRRRRRHQTASDDIANFFKRDFLLKDDRSTNFRLRRHYHHQEEEREVEEEEDTFFNTRLFKESANEEPKVLDLSMKNEAAPPKRNYNVHTTSPQAPPQQPQQQHVLHQQDGQKSSESSNMDTEKWQKNAIPPNRKQFPRISEMLEKMHLRDDEWRQAMQVDSYRAALESTRERLIHTHPEMFVGWLPDGDTANKMDIAFQQQQTKVNENPNFCKQGASNLQQMQQDMQRSHMQTASNLLQTPSRTTSSVKCEEETRSLPPLLVATPLRSCSAVTVNAEMVGKAHPRPLAGSCSCPEVPSLVNRGQKSRWITQKSERPKGRPPRKSSAETASNPPSTVTASVSPFANDISICKFKLVKGLHPVLEEKKTLHVPLPVRSSPNSSPQRQSTPVVEVSSSSNSDFQFNFNPNSPASSLNRVPVAKESPLRTFKFHMEGQNLTDAGGGAAGTAGGVNCRAISPAGGVQSSHNRRVRKRSRKTLAREQLEATFREQGFLIKTQQVSSAEGAVYCKFRQLKKFTRYLFKSWKDHLPLEIQGGVENNNMQAPTPQATLNENTSTI